MHKILQALGAVVVAASSTTSVISCRDNNDSWIGNTQFTKMESKEVNEALRDYLRLHFTYTLTTEANEGKYRFNFTDGYLDADGKSFYDQQNNHFCVVGTDGKPYNDLGCTDTDKVKYKSAYSYDDVSKTYTVSDDFNKYLIKKEVISTDSPNNDKQELTEFKRMSALSFKVDQKFISTYVNKLQAPNNLEGAVSLSDFLYSVFTVGNNDVTDPGFMGCFIKFVVNDSKNTLYDSDDQTPSTSYAVDQINRQVAADSSLKKLYAGYCINSDTSVKLYELNPTEPGSYVLFSWTTIVLPITNLSQK